MDNEQGYAEAYREVIHEDKIKVGSSTKAPDYGFTLFGQRKFFVDAKKPAINIKGDIAPAYQVRRYGWSAKVPISIVTDFEEFSIYDCTKKPKPTDKASVSRIKYITYDQYLEEFDFLWEIFAKENLPKGRFDKYVKSDTRRKGTATVDDEFLKSIEQWRTYLATTIALRNKLLNEDEINYAVQKIIDRIIFLRMCEDRGVEPYGELRKAIKKGNIYENLLALYRMADAKYNSGLFDFKQDKITPGLTVDNKVMKNIINELYYPNCEYEFSVMPADILGSVYERFLGKTIRLTPAHHAKIEEKPEVRKAGGVYYTPKYIVDYIVENTVGKLTENKTPKQVEKIKICDPACGSGSFLIGAYQYLLDWHLNYYAGNPPKKKKDNPLSPDGNLTTAEKKRILLNNIFGVDIDSQAVEVTKLNLLLKALEGETRASISQQLTLFHERVLPNLDKNIQCGNSLIGSDFYDNQLDLFPEQMKKINAFDWEEGFPYIFRKSSSLAEASAKTGFDVVIGNPPYGALFSENEKDYLKKNYSSYTLRGESYILFLERANTLLVKKGLLGYIIPDTYLNLDFSNKIRKYILANTYIKEIVLMPSNVFADATVDTTLLFTEKSNPSKTYNASNVWIKLFAKKNVISDLSEPQRQFEAATETWYNQNSFNLQCDKKEGAIIERIEEEFPKVNEIAEMFSGIKGYEVGKGSPPQTAEIRDNKPFTSDTNHGNDWSILYDGKHISKYQILWKNNNWINYGEWLAAPRKPEQFEGEKILIRKIIGKTLLATYVPDTLYCNTLLFIFKLKPTAIISYQYSLGVLNSKFIGWYFRKKFQIAPDDTFPQIMIRDILQFVFPTHPKKTKHDKISSLVTNLLMLNKQLQDTNLETQRQQIQRAIAHAEKRIDELVYELYGLTEEEIAIIEKPL